MNVENEIFEAIKRSVFYEGPWPITDARISYCKKLVLGDVCTGEIVEFENPRIDANFSVTKSIALRPEGMLHWQDSVNCVSAMSYTLMYALSSLGLVSEIPRFSLEELAKSNNCDKGAFAVEAHMRFRGMINPTSFPGMLKIDKIIKDPVGTRGLVYSTGYLGQRHEHIYENVEFGIKI